MKLSLGKSPTRPWHFYLAGKIFAGHSVLTLCGFYLAYLQRSYVLLAVFVALWLLAWALYVEWRNA